MANLSVHFSPSTRGAVTRTLQLLGTGSIAAVLRRALALYVLRVGRMSPEELQMEAVEIKAHRRSSFGFPEGAA